MLGALASLLLAGATMAPPADAACPSKDAIAFEMDRLGASAALAALGSPEVTVEGTKMRVVLRGRDGSAMGTREVAAPRPSPFAKPPRWMHARPSAGTARATA